MKINFLSFKTYDFLFGLDDVSVGKINKAVGLLEEYGHTVRYPHTKHISDGVFELRVIGSSNIRIFFIFKNDEAIILHAIIKKTQKIPKKEIKHVLRLKNKLQ
jgi:phage-related protein